MGLLDSFNPNFASSPQFQKGLLMMAMASGNPRTSANAAGLLQMQQQEEDAKFKRGLLSMEMQQKQAQLDKANKLQAAMGGLFGGSQTAPSQQDMQRVGMESGDGFTGHASPQAISTATQMAQPRKSGLAGATIDQIAAIQGMGGPNLLDAWKLAQTGVKQDAGAYYKDANGNLQYLPTVDKGIGVMNGVATALPGYAQANADIQGAQTAAQEFAKVAPQTDLARNQAYIKAASTPMQGVDSNGNPAFTSEAAQLGMRDPTQGGNGQQSPLVEGGLRPGMTNQQKASQQATEQLNSNWVTNNYNPTIAAAGAAGDVLTNVRVSRDAMKNMGGTGWGTDVKAQAANMLTSLGIGGENAKLYATNAQTFNQAAMSRLQTVLNAAKGPQTEGDAARASKTYAQLGNTTEANAFILNLMEAQAQRDIMKSEFYQQAMPLARSRGDLTEVDREWQKRQPSVYSMPSMAQYNR